MFCFILLYVTEFIDLRKLKNDELLKLRRKIVRLKEAGRSGKEIESITRVRQNRISEIWRKYRLSGDDGIKPGVPGRKRGEKCLLSEPMQNDIRRILTKKMPDDLGMPYSLWTRQIACDFIKREYDVRLPLRSMTNYLKKWGFVCRTPKKTEAYLKSKAFSRFIEDDFPDIVRRAKSENVGIYWYCETRVGEMKMIAAATARGTARFTFARGRMTQEKFISLIRRLIRYADRKVFFIAEDKKAFRGEKVINWLKSNENRVEIFYHPSAFKKREK